MIGDIDLDLAAGIAMGFIRARGLGVYWRRRPFNEYRKADATGQNTKFTNCRQCQHAQAIVRYSRIATSTRSKRDSAVAASVCHVVFNPSAAGGLRDALRQAGREERVFSRFDSLSFGPINPPDPALRAEWVEKELGYTGWEDVVGKEASFWSEALSVNNRKIGWLSRRSAQEYAGFLEWLWRLGEEPIEVVDLTDVVVAGSKDGPTKPLLAI